MKIKRDRQRNRIYVDDIDRAVADALHMRYDGQRRWLAIADWPGEARLKELTTAILLERDGGSRYDAATRAMIPPDYRMRHDALFGGTVNIGDWSEEIRPVADGFLRQPKWEQVASHETHGHTGLIAGRVADSWCFYRCALIDGRYAYREVVSRGFGDDVRETYWMPEDLWQAVCLAEIRARGITREKAEEWLAEYRGCVGTELYEFAATIQPAPLEVK